MAGVQGIDRALVLFDFVSGGGLMLLNPNSAATLGGRIDPELFRGTILTSAVINLELLISEPPYQLRFLR